MISCSSDTPPNTDILPVSDTPDTAALDIPLPGDTTNDTTPPSDTPVVPEDTQAVDGASSDTLSDVSELEDTETEVSPTPDDVPTLDDTESPDLISDVGMDASVNDAGPPLADIFVADTSGSDALVPNDISEEVEEDVIIPNEKSCVTEQDDCFPDWYCQAQGCGGGLPGTCKAMPLDCSLVPIKGVCGCDGQTYLSTCHAAASGANVLAPGSCPLNAVLECNVEDPTSCADGEFCMGGCVGQGICVVPDLECSGQGSGWVCGCNGVSHTDACKAIKLGTNVKDFGYCEGDNEPPQTCGGADNVQCPEGKHCDITGCEANKEGLCQGIWNPATGTPGLLCLPGEPQECGCDGKTYLNKCQRILADVAKAKTGPCDGPNTCKLESGNEDCPIGLSCVGPSGICTGEGTCQTTDFVCCLIDQAKVCGCDGKTYGCKCSANKLGIPIQKLGECGQP